MLKKSTQSNLSNDSLFILIKSLSKSEKRQFSLYVSRLEGNNDAKFFVLFKLLDKQKKYDEQKILKNDFITKQQLSNVKAHLYKQILTSLRLNPIHKNIRIQIREQLDFATILYQKGLYKQSLKLLDKAKILAINNEEKNVAYEIIELEKIIENQYITRSVKKRADELTLESKKISYLNTITCSLSNLSLQLYSLLLKKGYIKSNDELEEVNNYFKNKLPIFSFSSLGFREKLWLYKTYLWHSLLTQNFIQSYRYSYKWVMLFNNNPRYKKNNPVFYLKGKNYLLESLFFLRKKNNFKNELNKFELEILNNEIPLNNNTEILTFIYLYFNKLNYYFLTGKFKKGEYLVKKINLKINFFFNRLDNYHILIFYYKIACLYFGMNKLKESIKYIEKIIISKDLTVGQDLHCFARILNLIAHYDAGIDYDLEQKFKDTYKFLIQMKNLQKVQKILINSFKNFGNLYPYQFKKEFKRVYNELKKYEKHPYEKRAFLYLDILSWLESKIKNEPISKIIKMKLKTYNN